MKTSPEHKIVLALAPILKERGMSVYKLAHETELTSQAIYNIMNGKTSPRLSTISRIAAALNVTHIELLETVK